MCRTGAIIRFDKQSVTPDLLVALLRSEHGGRDGMGFATGNTDGTSPIHYWRRPGAASSLFGPHCKNKRKARQLVKRFPGDYGLFHNQYSTADGRNAKAIQPHGFKHGGRSVVGASNGDIPYYQSYADSLVQRRNCRLASRCDAEAILNDIGSQTFGYVNEKGVYVPGINVLDAMENVGNSVQGSFSLVTMTPDGDVVAMRDPSGIRPLYYGFSSNGAMFASETAIMDMYNSDIQEVPPGTIISISSDGEVQKRTLKSALRKECLMEFYYLSRPDSLAPDGRSFSQIRYELGYQAGLEWLEQGKPKPDLVIAIPKSGIPAAQGFGAALGVPVREGIYKEPWSGRLFQDDEKTRKNEIKNKLRVIADIVYNKRVVFVDDSNVRGQQGNFISSSARTLGAKSVGLVYTAQPYKYPCFLGLNTPDISKLIANNRTVEEVRKLMSLDNLLYLSLAGAFKVLGSQDFCTGCFTNKYPVPVPANGAEV